MTLNMHITFEMNGKSIMRALVLFSSKQHTK